MWVPSALETTHFASESENFINPAEDIVVQRVQLLRQSKDDLHYAKVKWFFCDPELNRKKDKECVTRAFRLSPCCWNYPAVSFSLSLRPLSVLLKKKRTFEE